jgi:hypothetical protein
MILKDGKGLILDNTGDGGDSCNRTALYEIFLSQEKSLLKYFVDKEGNCVRHPVFIPWNNKNNFTKDQLKPLIAALYLSKQYDLVFIVFLAHIQRFFFCQNFERDYEGTKKYPWPHIMKGGDPKDNGKLRMFDFADPLLPNDIWMFIICCRSYVLMPFIVAGIPAFIFNLFLFCKFNKGNDECQTIVECMVNGKWAVLLYKRWRPDWKFKLKEYWEINRDQSEFSNAIIKKLESYV